MIIFINGSFGVGKTTVAEMLVKRISNSLLFDPVVHALQHLVRE
jgi:dephospho-CoA kinase